MTSVNSHGTVRSIAFQVNTVFSQFTSIFFYIERIEGYRVPKQAWQYHPKRREKHGMTKEEMVGPDLGAGTDQ
jgi:hypothetical protein